VEGITRIRLAMGGDGMLRFALRTLGEVLLHGAVFAVICWALWRSAFIFLPPEWGGPLGALASVAVYGLVLWLVIRAR
jgi:hypothetical protein